LSVGIFSLDEKMKQEEKMKKIFVAALVICLLTPALAFAEETIKGTILGYKCVMKEMKCAASPDDPIADREGKFVLYTKDGKFYFVPNVERYRLSLLIGKEVKITGALNGKKDTILARTIYDKRDGEWISYMIFNNGKQSNYMKRKTVEPSGDWMSYAKNRHECERQSSRHF
jgi:hypothetical protein